MPSPFGEGIVLIPFPASGAPSTGTWEEGTVIVDAVKTMWVCLAAGTPGTWGRVGVDVTPPDLVATYPEFIDTFPNGVQAGMGWTLNSNGGSAGSTQIAPPAGTTGRNAVIGVVQANTGTATTGRTGAILGANLLRFESGNTYDIWWRVLAAQLATAAENYRFRVGFIDSTTNAEPADGAYFEYNRASSNNWILNTASNSARTPVTSGVAVSATRWIDMRIRVDGTTQSAEFFIDDVSQGTITTNVPTAAGRETSVGYVIHKTAGGNARYVCLDRVYLKLNAA
jgi:hypothetical protein